MPKGASGSQPTYEELKLDQYLIYFIGVYRSQPTYEELKPPRL